MTTKKRLASSYGPYSPSNSARSLPKTSPKTCTTPEGGGLEGPVRGASTRACCPDMNVDADRRSPPCALVIFGASGDLTARKLLPALERLAAYGALPGGVALIGVARTPMT